MYDHFSPKPPKFEARGRQLAKLVYQKFGSEHGAKTRAANAAGAQTSNFSRMLSGHQNTPQKYMNALAELPDYQEPPPPHKFALEDIDKNAKTYVLLPPHAQKWMHELEAVKHKGTRPMRTTVFHEVATETIILALDIAHRQVRNAAPEYFDRMIAKANDLLEYNRLNPKRLSLAETEAATKRAIAPYEDPTDEEDPLS